MKEGGWYDEGTEELLSRTCLPSNETSSGMNRRSNATEECSNSIPSTSLVCGTVGPDKKESASNKRDSFNASENDVSLASPCSLALMRDEKDAGDAPGPSPWRYVYFATRGGAC